MLREHSTVFRKLMIVVDFAVVAASYYLAYILRSRFDHIGSFSGYFGTMVLFAVIWLSLLYYSGVYRTFRIKRLAEILLIIFKVALLSFLFFLSVLYVVKIPLISRIMIVLSFFFAAAFLMIEKIILVLLIKRLRRKGYNSRSILIIGTGKRAQAFASLIEQHSEWGFEILGFVDEDASKSNEVINGYKVLGSFQDIPRIVHDNIVDEVAFVVPRSWLDRIEGIMHFFEDHGIKIDIAVDYFDLKLSRATQADVPGFPMITFEPTSDKLWHLLLKRIFDVVFSGIALLILSPLFLVLSLLVKLSSPGPVLFSQERCGLNGRRFKLYKFRTMHKDAEERLAELRKYNEMAGPVFKMKDDPRLTKIGKIMRKFSLDEFPQLWNVFQGDMSLIGPRPPIPKEVAQYDDWQRRRLSMKPGLSCLWQVNGRNKITDFNEWMNLDIKYIDTWSLSLDFKILCRTIPVVLFGIGAK